MSQVEPFRSWRLRITAVHEHQWEYEENGAWNVFHAADGEPIRLHQESTGYIFYDEAWLSHAGGGPAVLDLSIEARDPAAANPFGVGAKPSFSPVTTDASSHAEAYRWNIVGRDSAYPEGFPQTTQEQAWSFNVVSGDVTVDPEMIILRPDPPPTK